MIELLRRWPKDEPVPAISLRQPWATAVLYFGKDVENRSRWPFRHRGPLILHASKTTPHIDDFRRFFDLAKQDGCPQSILKDFKQEVNAGQCPEVFLFGCILGVVNLTEVFGPDDEVPDDHPARESPWADEDADYWLYFEDVVRVEAVDFKGAVGMFKVPYEVASTLRPLPSMQA